jgi:hypothetical protein
MRNPRQEAFDRLAGRYEVRVLEPSPPAVDEEPWFADDPAARGGVAPGREVVSPVSTGDVLWDDLVSGNQDLAAWCSERWLGAYRRLTAPPAELVTTRLALHRVAEDVMTPARRAANGKIALRYVAGGFGTPFYGDDMQMRVDGTQLVTDSAAGPRREALDGVDEAASRFLGDWFGFAASVLEQLRAEADPSLDASRVQLWTEHFDLAVELGDEAAEARAGYGCSPGDEEHPEPYLYVVPSTSERASGEGWNATEFAGAELPYAELLAAADQREAALEFFRDRRDALGP